MAIGVLLRWALTGVVTLSLPFSHLRHTHSHLGYFGLLFPLAWQGWRAANVHTPELVALFCYALSTIVACVGFEWSGYGPIAIAGSTSSPHSSYGAPCHS